MPETTTTNSDLSDTVPNKTLEAISIGRHIMQQLLHEALVAGESACMGLLTGRGAVIDGILPISKQSFRAFNSGDNRAELAISETPSLIGIYQSTDANCQFDQGQTSSLRHYFISHSKQQPCCYLLLDINHKGRIEARCFADAECNIPISLNMQEEAALYPIPANG